MAYNCVICGEGFPADGGILCCRGLATEAAAIAPVHFTCRECFKGWAREEAGPGRVTEGGGAVRCPWRGAVGAGVAVACLSQTWDLADEAIEGLLDHETERALRRAAIRALAVAREEASQWRRDAAVAQEQRVAAAVSARAPAAAAGSSSSHAAASPEARLATLKSALEAAFPSGPGEDGCLHCPRCRHPFVDYDGCAALSCDCGARFCALCLQTFSDSETLHAHFLPPVSAHAGTGEGYNISLALYYGFHREKRRKGIRAAVAALAGESGEIRAALLVALGVPPSDPDPAASVCAPAEALPAADIVPGAGVDDNNPAAVVAEMTRLPADVATSLWGCRALVEWVNRTELDDSYPRLLRPGAEEAIHAVLASLRRLARSEAVAVAACTMLYTMTASSIWARRSLAAAADCAAVIIAAIQAHPAQGVIAEKCSHTLALVAEVSDDERPVIVNAQGVCGVGAVLTTWHAALPVVTSCLTVLQRASTRGAVNAGEVACVNSGINAVISVLVERLGDGETASLCIRTLNILAHSVCRLFGPFPPNHRVFADAIAAVVTAIRARPLDPQVAAGGCEALRLFAAFFAQTYTIGCVADVGGDAAPTVVAAMLMHGSAATVAAKGAAALASFACLTGGLPAVTSAGGALAFAAALRTLHADEEHATAVLAALASFVSGSSDAAEDFRRALCVAGGVVGVCAILTSRLDSPILVEGCCALLRLLTDGSDAGRKALRVADCTVPIVAAVRALPLDVARVRGGLEALRSLSGIGDEERGAVIAAGGVSFAVWTLDRGSASEDQSLAEGAMGLLAAVATGSDASFEAVISADGDYSAIRACKLHPTSAAIARAAAALLARVASGKDKSGYLVTATAHAVLVRALRTHLIDGGIAYWCCSGLAHLSQQCEEVADAGAIDALVFALRAHSHCDRIVEQACTALALLASGSRERGRTMLEAGAPAALVGVLRRLRDAGVDGKASSEDGGCAGDAATAEAVAAAREAQRALGALARCERESWAAVVKAGGRDWL